MSSVIDDDLVNSKISLAPKVNSAMPEAPEKETD
jgi:hypothetical protein